MTKEMLSPEFYQTLVRRSTTLISVVEVSGVYKYISDSAHKITGYHPEELLGKTIMEYVHSQDLQTIKAAFDKLRTTHDVEVPLFRFRTKDSGWRWMEATLSNLTDDPQVNGYVIEARDMTGDKKAQHTLERGQNFYNSILQKHPDAVFTLTPDGIFEHVNDHICQILSYSKAEIIGDHFTKFIATSFFFEANKAISRAHNCEQTSLEGKVVNKYGKVRTLNFDLIPVCTDHTLTSILVIAKDISAEKIALKELEKLSLIASKAVSCVVITDAAGRMEWVNGEFTRVTGYSMLEALGKKPGELLQGPETDQNAIQEMKKIFYHHEPISLEILNYRKNGEKFWFHMDISPIFNDEGQVSQYFAIQYDVSERKEAEKKMLLLSEDLMRHNRELQQFNYIVSHNLRAPVANIVGLVSLLEHMDEKNANFVKVLTKLRQTSHGLDMVIRDLDEILSLRDSNNSGLSEVVCLNNICGEVVHSLQDRIEATGAEIYENIPADVCIHGNRAYVYSIFHNLLSNSIKYRDLERQLRISISYKTEGDQHVIIFRDNGMGMDLQRFGNSLFKLYGKFDKKTEGRGIGLYMVKAQIETLGGSINVESTPGEGTTFYLRFNKELF
ncbi:PAS domain S-box protein [Pontibacter sp. E15-1]|uniref:PAS domain-containing sensor histidine kinase n=1 Tax=Pontibacter sp. E15-1 TaxID=2919918 RepID=UPI001F50186E|nr:PAS domain-containing sensor histidine kinase [Pontibacter sp. E15-1]MCJ8163430.1 PAS domain S-box protein [Pontibacter sp. E15-1]